MSAPVKMKSFANRIEPIPFEINGDVFYAHPSIPPHLLQEIKGFRNISERLQDEGIEPLLLLMDQMLRFESSELFRARMKTEDRSIEIPVINEIIMWLMEEWTVRPTQSSVISSPGSNTDEIGSNSTVGVLADALLGTPSVQPNSSP